MNAPTEVDLCKPVNSRTIAEFLNARKSTSSSGAEFWGDWNRDVTHVYVSWSASLDHLQLAHRSGNAVMICRVHPLFSPPSGLDATIATAATFDRNFKRAREVYDYKLALISDSNVSVIYAPFAWDLGSADRRSRALAQRLGHANIEHSSEPAAVVSQLDVAVSISQLTRNLLTMVGRSRALLTGTPAQNARTIAIIAGLASPEQIMRVLEDPKVTVIITGETIEWEGTPLIQDLVSAGRTVTMITIGNSASEDPAGELLAKEITKAFPSPCVRWLPTLDPTWVPEEVESIA